MSIESACIYTAISKLDLLRLKAQHFCSLKMKMVVKFAGTGSVLHCSRVLANFDFDLCVRMNFHKSLFWDPIMAAEGPYF